MEYKSDQQYGYIEQKKYGKNPQGFSQIVFNVCKGPRKDDLNGIVPSVAFEKFGGHKSDNEALEDIKEFKAVKGQRSRKRAEVIGCRYVLRGKCNGNKSKDDQTQPREYPETP